MNYVPDIPEKEEEQPVCFCDICNGDLYEGDRVYKIDGKVICTTECLGNYYGGFNHILEKGEF